MASLCSPAVMGQADSWPLAGSETVTLTSPLDYQVFQRKTRIRGSILVEGTIAGKVSRVQARILGPELAQNAERWRRVSLNHGNGHFHGSLPAPAGGFYQVEVQVLTNGKTVADTTVEHVGVGEVFVVAGQSNSTNYGEVRQQTQTSMVTAFDGKSWRIADDPQPGVQDNSQKGSFIPAFGDAMYRKYKVPIGVADVGRGSTSVRQWLPAGRPVFVMPTMEKYVVRDSHGALVSDGTLFNGMMMRIHELGKHGFRALLWHQGESDANQPTGHQITPAQYRAMLTDVIHASQKAAGWKIPWFVAEATYHPGQPKDVPFEEAQMELWKAGVANAGPNTDLLTAEYRQNHGKGVHMNDEGLKKHGQMWAECVEAYLDHKLK
ncbi:sialate O-acetylesterase [Edaphobacter acidisoli]|nr:sialate O-acetylesterase [Edaphobacter acidisoli]